MNSDPVRPQNPQIESAGQAGSADGKTVSGNINKEAQKQPISGNDIEVYAAEETSEVAGAKDVELDAEEAEERRVLPTPVLPSQADIDEHWIDHYPYRSWCGKCVEGRGRERPHFRTHDSRKIPTVVFDYCFLSKDGIYTREEWGAMPAEAEGAKIIVVR